MASDSDLLSNLRDWMVLGEFAGSHCGIMGIYFWFAQAVAVFDGHHF